MHHATIFEDHGCESDSSHRHVMEKAKKHVSEDRYWEEVVVAVAFLSSGCRRPTWDGWAPMTRVQRREGLCKISRGNACSAC